MTPDEEEAAQETSVERKTKVRPKNKEPQSDTAAEHDEAVAPNGVGRPALNEAEEPGHMPLDYLPGLSLSPEGAAEERHGPALMYPVVGFGASAGGLQAFRAILENLDPNTGMAFVLVTHLSPDQKSFLAEIVERYTQMPVLPAEDGQQPMPNHLYVLQPNQSLALRDGIFRVEIRSVGDRVPRTIDKFFFSLAADQKNHAIGVVLSGADADGALGLKAIKGEGGIAMVQSPDTAQHSGMPLSSIAADHVDLVVAPAEIALELARLAQQFSRPGLRSLENGVGAPDDDKAFQKILQLLKAASGIDFRHYKPETIRRRMARRMILMRMEHMPQYLRFLQTNGDELRALQEDVLVKVTRFFRDASFWEVVQGNVLPLLFQGRPADRPLRIWCAGCSTGEEAYSLAILALEYLSQNNLDTPLQIFGTDASERSIGIARAGVYPDSIAGEVSAERLRRYFTKIGRGYQVSKRVRDACVFARQNLSGDPPFSHIDILSCRNVMIYLNQALQRQIILTFHYALEPGAYILLGMSEGLRDFAEVFSAVDRKHKIYLKTGLSLPANTDRPRAFAWNGAAGQPGPAPVALDTRLWPDPELQRAADRLILARLGPPGLIIDDRMNVLQSRGPVSPYLEISPGAVSWNLLRVLRHGIVNEVQKAAERAIGDNVPASLTATMLDEKLAGHQVRIDVLPITSSSARPRCFLVLFQQVQNGAEVLPSEPAGQPQLSGDEKDSYAARLREDLASTRFHLESLVEERDARNQDLVSANEEIQSANEELQSTNEELETTKEELQSANEELQTVNDELQQRNNVLTQTGNDLSNLLNSVNIPVLMLTCDLRIRQFTPPMQRLLSARQTDIGRPIGDIRLQLSIESIEPILNEVMESLVTREIEVQDRDGRWYLLRVRPYRTTENKIDGLVVVLVDIDELRRDQQNLMDARDFASSVVESVPVPIVVLSDDWAIRTANTAFRELAQLPAKELEGRSLPELAHLLWGIERMGSRFDPLLKAQAGTAIEFEHQSSLPPHKTLSFKARALSTDGASVVLLMVEDITLRRQAERLLATQTRVLESEIATAEHKLNRTQDELRSLTGHLFNVQEDERQRVARELHDDISQRLSLLEMLLHEIRGSGYDEKDLDRLQQARENVGILNTDVRRISHRLHPAILSDLGLSAALQALVKEFGERENMPATYLAQNLPENWPAEAATAIYRIAQEALRNVSKHAGKTHVKVVLTGTGDRLQLKVMDFGTGFDQDVENPAPGLGMISMQERARLAGGALAVQSSLGEGTTVTVEIPLGID